MELVVNTDTLSQTNSNQLRSIFKEEGPKLFGFIKKQLPDIEDAEDVLQDVLTDYAESFVNSGPIEQTTGWLYRVARNRIADLFRKKKTERFPEFEMDPDSHWLENVMVSERTPDDLIWNESAMRAIIIALNKLPTEQKEVFVMHEIDGLSYKEISFKTSVSIPTLTSRKRYAIQSLQFQLQELYQDLTNNL